MIKIDMPSRCHPIFDAFVRDPKIVDIVANLMRPNIKLYFDPIFAKSPYARVNRYHQDSVATTSISSIGNTCSIR